MNSLTDKEINRASDGIDKALSTATRSNRGEVAFRILSVDKFVRSGWYETSNYDLVVVDECSTVKNEDIAANFKSYLQGFSANVLEILMSKERGLNFGEEIDKMDKNNRLLSVIKAFSELDLDPRTIDNVKMGYIFEELIRKFSENAEAGDHYTGRDIIKLMVNILLAEGCDDM